MASCAQKKKEILDDPVIARVASVDYKNLLISGAGSVGERIRAVIERDGLVIETTASVLTASTVLIPYTQPIENGDKVTVQASNDNFIDSNASDEIFIPTPDFWFTNYIRLYFGKPNSIMDFPNSAATDPVKVYLTFTDRTNKTLDLELSGVKSAILSIDDDEDLLIPSNGNNFTINTDFGPVSVEVNQQAGFDYNYCRTLAANVSDQRGFFSAQAEENRTDLLLQANREPMLVAGEQEYILFH